MEQCIIENNEVHLFGMVLLVVGGEFRVTLRPDLVDALAGLVYEWCGLDNVTVLIEHIFSLEVSEEVVSHQLLILEAETVTEFLFGNSVEHVLEDLLVSVGGELIDEGSLALMSPEGDQETLP